MITKLEKEFTEDYFGYFVGTENIQQFCYGIYGVGGNYKFINNNFEEGIEEFWITEDDYLGESSSYEDFGIKQQEAIYYLIFDSKVKIDEERRWKLKDKLCLNYLGLKQHLLMNYEYKFIISEFKLLKILLNIFKKEIKEQLEYESIQERFIYLKLVFDSILDDIKNSPN